jgi:hypothetical protein
VDQQKTTQTADYKPDSSAKCKKCGVLITKSSSYCHNCGETAPWTETKISNLQNLINTTFGLSRTDREVFNKNMVEIIKSTPMIELAIIRVKSILNRINKEKIPMLKTKMTDLLNEASKKRLFPK